MRKAIVLSIGNELTEGLIQDTNSKYLTQRLKLAGYLVVRTETLPDDLEIIVQRVQAALSEADLVVTTGGLGPTEDDLTREAVAQAIGRALILDDRLAAQLVERALKLYGKAPEIVKKQALVVDGATLLQNDVGTAPGQLLELGEKKVVLLPGPPSELVPMFDKIYEKLKTPDALYTRRVKTLGIPEAVLMDEYGSIIYADERVTVATMASYERGVEVRFTGPLELRAQIDRLADSLIEALGNRVYATDDDEMSDTLFKLLKARSLKVALAESCTGGMTSSLLVDVPGVSDVFLGSVVAYSNDAKVKILGVREETLRLHGAVSEECVTEMAIGVRKLLGADLALAISGVAGPTGGSERKPVGTVCIAVDGASGCVAKTFSLRGDRNSIRRRSALVGLNTLRLYILGGLE